MTGRTFLELCIAGSVLGIGAWMTTPLWEPSQWLWFISAGVAGCAIYARHSRRRSPQ